MKLLLRSKDGEVFEVEKPIAMQINFVKGMLEGTYRVCARPPVETHTIFMSAFYEAFVSVTLQSPRRRTTNPSQRTVNDIARAYVRAVAMRYECFRSCTRCIRIRACRCRRATGNGDSDG